MITTYKTVSKPYHDRLSKRRNILPQRIRQDIMQAAKKADTSVDVSMLSMIRALWKDLGDEDRGRMGTFTIFFERLVKNGIRRLRFDKQSGLDLM
jgi:hypothetical protein